MDGQYWKRDQTMSTNEWLLTSDFWQFLEPWRGRWKEYKIFIASCTDNIYDLENERWLLGDMIDHVGINGSRVAEGLSASKVGLVIQSYYVSLVSSYGHQFGILLPVSWGSFRSWVPLGCPQWLPGSTISHEICTEFCFLVLLFFFEDWCFNSDTCKNLWQTDCLDLHDKKMSWTADLHYTSYEIGLHFVLNNRLAPAGNHPLHNVSQYINGSANERGRYTVTSSLIGWAHSQNDAWWLMDGNLWNLTYP